MSHTNQNYLNVPISQETINHFENYIEMTEMDASSALEWAINRLTSPYWADEGFPKRGIINISGKSFPCWIVGESEKGKIKTYRIVRGTSVDTYRADQVEILDD